MATLNHDPGAAARRRVTRTAMLAALGTALAGSGPAVLPATRTSAAPAVVATRVALGRRDERFHGQPKRVALGADALLASAAASESALGWPEASLG